jgi:HD-like signal output (HDOD) protein/ActR/RegA family two-component response regulator
MRVLFVDDEVRVLEALERVLFDLETTWHTDFASSASEAFTLLAKQPYDVVVSDLRMSGIDGVALLTRVREKYPRTVRIVLSGHSDEEAALKMVPVAHQFLAKPCATETLHRIIARTEQLTTLLGDRKLQGIVGQVASLPSTPHLHRELRALLERDDASTPGVAAIIKQDPAMTGKLLQVAGSAFFNSSTSVTDVEAAVMRLGLRTMRNLSLCLGVFECAAHGGASPTTSVEALQRRSQAIANTAASMAKLPEDASAAYLAGLLCDVGQLVLAGAAPERLYVTQAEAAKAGLPAHVAEASTWGATHAEIGGYLLGLWGLPFQIVEAVANHHSPERHADGRVGLPQLVWLAACIVDGEQPDVEALHRFGVEELHETSRRAFEKGKR